MKKFVDNKTVTLDIHRLEDSINSDGVRAFLITWPYDSLHFMIL